VQERTEEEALERRVLLTLGTPVGLRTLSWSESDAWLSLVAEEAAGTDVSEGDAPADFRVFLTASSAAALRLVAAYDVAGVLGGVEGIKERGATKRQVREALEVLVQAEDPFGEDAVRSVVAAFGEPSRTLWRTVAMVVAEAGFLRALWTTGLGARTGSDMPTSGDAGPASSSSSDGPTPITARRPRKPSAPSTSSVASRKAISGRTSRTTGASASERTSAGSPASASPGRRPARRTSPGGSDSPPSPAMQVASSSVGTSS
jgi:hypothetical protein